MIVKDQEIQIGDRIVFKSDTRYSNEKAEKKVNGFHDISLE